MLAATTANPNKTKTRLRATYPGFLTNARSFCNEKHQILILRYKLLKTNVDNKDFLLLHPSNIQKLSNTEFLRIFYSV